jgi:surface polysaccharide O-acyltransferase-like enzyme
MPPIEQTENDRDDETTRQQCRIIIMIYNNIINIIVIILHIMKKNSFHRYITTRLFILLRHALGMFVQHHGDDDKVQICGSYCSYGPLQLAPRFQL